MTDETNSLMTGRGAPSSRCRYCNVVNKVCFWGAYPEAPWKRPSLLMCALLLLAATAVLFWFFHDHKNVPVLYALGTPLALLATLGLRVAVHGCDACVARMLASV